MAAAGYKTIYGPGTAELIVSRSRFIAQARPVSDEAAALRFIGEIKKQRWDATHNVWAYALDPSAGRCGDDGEPRGTAGFPILEVMRKEGVQAAAIVITRYFGGVKLGAGGLARTYARAAKLALETAGIVERRPFLTCYAETEYALAEKFRRELARQEFPITGTLYQDAVMFTVAVPPDRLESFDQAVAELTAGRGKIRRGPEVYLAIDQDKMLLPGGDDHE
ncbi:MAG: IMPACT family protein [Peptococcaceae bacterium]|jgi:uncharacterized YigZ family protein|nr:IMPACT family protein [Peptococcaceae bacterium]